MSEAKSTGRTEVLQGSAIRWQVSKYLFSWLHFGKRFDILKARGGACAPALAVPYWNSLTRIIIQPTRLMILMTSFSSCPTSLMSSFILLSILFTSFHWLYYIILIAVCQCFFEKKLQKNRLNMRFFILFKPDFFWKDRLFSCRFPPLNLQRFAPRKVKDKC